MANTNLVGRDYLAFERLFPEISAELRLQLCEALYIEANARAEQNKIDSGKELAVSSALGRGKCRGGAQEEFFGQEHGLVFGELAVFSAHGRGEKSDSAKSSSRN